MRVAYTVYCHYQLQTVTVLHVFAPKVPDATFWRGTQRFGGSKGAAQHFDRHLQQASYAASVPYISSLNRDATCNKVTWCRVSHSMSYHNMLLSVT